MNDTSKHSIVYILSNWNMHLKKKKNKLQQTSKPFELCSILFISVRVNDVDAGR